MVKLIERKSILIFADFLYPATIGGSAKFAGDLNTRLAYRKVNLKCIMRSPHRIYSGDIQHKFDYPVLSTSDVLEIIKLLFFRRWDIVISHHYLLGILSLFTWSAKRRVYFFHGPVEFESLAAGRSRFISRIKGSVESFVLRHQDQIFCLSDHMKQYIPFRYQRTVSICGPLHTYTNIEGEAIGSRESSFPLNLLTVRRLTPRTGVIELIDMVRSQDSRLSLTIAGTGEMLGDIKSQAPPHVKVLGYVSPEKLNSLYRGSDLLILPSIALEGFGLVIIEAIVRNTPVLVSNRAGGGADFLSGISSNFVYDPSCSPNDFVVSCLNAIRSFHDPDIHTILVDAVLSFQIDRFIDTGVLQD